MRLCRSLIIFSTCIFPWSLSRPLRSAWFIFSIGRSLRRSILVSDFRRRFRKFAPGRFFFFSALADRSFRTGWGSVFRGRDGAQGFLIENYRMSICQYMLINQYVNLSIGQYMLICRYILMSSVYQYTSLPINQYINICMSIKVSFIQHFPRTPT